MERKGKYEAEIAAMPPGLDRAVLKEISMYISSRPISRGELLVAVAQMGFQITDEKQVRDAIRELRRQGNLICGRSGKNGGYYMARSLQEYHEFRQKEFASKITDMAETMRTMDAAARAQFGDGYQIGLPI